MLIPDNGRIKTVIVITGPTASGKSALAVDVAEHYDTEIVSADSRQIFTGIPIVTAMPDDEQRSRVRHHLIDMLPLESYYSASTFEEDAMSIITNLLKERDTVVVCGGSMMYVDALCNGIDILPTVPDEVRLSLGTLHRERGDEWLLAELDRLDPVYGRSVDRRNIKRVFHAVEVSMAADAPYSSLLTGRKVERPFEIRKVSLSMPREVLFDRINQRVHMMVEQGLEEEARKVYPLRGLNSLNTVGLKEMFAMFDGEMSLDEAIARIQKNTRVYAKKQITWYQRDKNMEFLSPEEAKSALCR